MRCFKTIKRRARYQYYKVLLRLSSLFDEEWYLKNYPYIKKLSVEPAFHYLEKGWREGKDPSPFFDTNWYLDNYPDVDDAKINPLIHFLKYGKKEGRFANEENRNNYFEYYLEEPQNLDFIQKGSIFTNLFRYKLLYEHGGWWVDTDVFCLEYNLPDFKHFWAKQEPGMVNNAIIKFPKGDPICRHLLNQASEKSNQLQVWGQTGLILITEVLNELGDFGKSFESKTAYPIHYFETHFFWLPEYTKIVLERIKKSYFIHLWQNMFNHMGIDIFNDPPIGSILFYVYKHYNLLKNPHYENDDTTRVSILNYLKQEWVINRLIWRIE